MKERGFFVNKTYLQYSLKNAADAKTGGAKYLS
jgi:hypothetical protein